MFDFSALRNNKEYSNTHINKPKSTTKRWARKEIEQLKEKKTVEIMNTLKNWLPVKSVYGRKFYVTTTLSGKIILM